MMTMPLIELHEVRQSGLGEVVPQLPIGRRMHEVVRATVVRVFPVGHPKNRLGQVTADLQPLGDAPILYGVPMALPHAHQETGKSAAHSARRQPYEPKARNRSEGSYQDLRPGTQVFVQFLGGNLLEPLIIGAANGNGGGDAADRQVVDRLGERGELLDRAPGTRVTESEVGDYPRRVVSYNGTRTEIDNAGNHLVQTTTDREPVHPGHNGIPESPAPQGNYGVSTRGARHGNIFHTSGEDPDTGASSVGRQGRRTIGASDGSIIDETRDSTIGNIIRRLRSAVGRYWLSTKGSGDGRVFLGAKRAYAALGDDAEVSGADVIIDGGRVYIGSRNARYEIVLHPQLDQVQAQLWAAVDAHVHEGVTSGDDTSGPPTPATFAATWEAGSPECRANDIFADQQNDPDPQYQDDPEG